MKSRLFYSDAYKTIEAKLKDFLNQQDDFLSPSTARSTRAFGDALEGILGRHFDTILGDWCTEYSADFARRAMADLAFSDVDGLYYVVDVKTHRADTKFNMPNLTSVERLARFYEDDRNYFALLIVKYELDGVHAIISGVIFVPIEFLGWDCLTVGALGWGQIQIADAKRITISPQYSRKRWMLEMCDALEQFYPREIQKISERIERFRAVREFWLAKPDDR